MHGLLEAADFDELDLGGSMAFALLLAGCEPRDSENYEQREREEDQPQRSSPRARCSAVT
jgi:hypothetical protein